MNSKEMAIEFHQMTSMDQASFFHHLYHTHRNGVDLADALDLLMARADKRFDTKDDDKALFCLLKIASSVNRLTEGE